MSNCRDPRSARLRREPEAPQVPLEEPIHRYVFPIPAACPAPACPAPGASSAVQTQILQQLQCQNQLLVDLLGAVNSLTAAVLCRRES